MATRIELSDAVEQILDAIVASLSAQLNDGVLSDLEAVIRGARSRPLPKLPALWVIPEPARAMPPASGRTGLAEEWLMPVRLAALVSAEDPDDGSRLCVRYAAKARSVVLTDRRLGLSHVNDVVSTAFDPDARRSERNRNLYWADATVTVRFLIHEGATG